MFQIVEQTDEEKEKMYMKCTKKELVKMLIEANRILQNIRPVVVEYPDCVSGTYVDIPKTFTGI